MDRASDCNSGGRPMRTRLWEWNSVNGNDFLAAIVYERRTIMNLIAFRCLMSGALIFAAAMSSSSAAIRQISTVAGTGAPGDSGEGRAATEAQLNNPYGITRGPDGGLYICDMQNHRVRKVSRDGIITTVAGTGKRGYSGDGGPALQAELNEPYEVRFDKAGDMFFVEMRNHIVRRLDSRTKFISTVAGSGTAFSSTAKVTCTSVTSGIIAFARWT